MLNQYGQYICRTIPPFLNINTHQQNINAVPVAQSRGSAHSAHAPKHLRLLANYPTLCGWLSSLEVDEMNFNKVLIVNKLVWLKWSKLTALYGHNSWRLKSPGTAQFGSISIQAAMNIKQISASWWSLCYTMVTFILKLQYVIVSSVWPLAVFKHSVSMHLVKTEDLFLLGLSEQISFLFKHS